jgi:hypothetical protein
VADVPLPIPAVLAPATPADFMRLFPGEAACERAAFSVRWPNGFVCPACGGRRGFRRRTRRTIVCSRCRLQIDLTAGTLLHRSHLPLSTWFRAVFLATSRPGGLSASGLCEEIGLRRIETAIGLLRRIRSAMASADSDPVEGVVVLDEATAGVGACRAWAPRERGSPVVAGVFEVRGTGADVADAGRIRLRLLPSASARNLGDFVRDCVAPGSVLVTDGRRRHRLLDLPDYVHVPNLGRRRPARDDFRRIVRFEFAAVALVLAHTYRRRVEVQHLQGYLDEIAFLHNLRFLARGEGFGAVLAAALRGPAGPAPAGRAGS